MATLAVEDRGPEINGYGIAMIVLSIIAVALRFWSRYLAKKAGFWWDDWFALAALPFAIASPALSIYWVSIGLGKHINQISGSKSSVRFVLFVENFIYNTGISLVKISVLLFYSRVFRNVRSYRIALYVVGAILVGWWIAIDFLALFTCVPVQRAWQSNVPGHCLDQQKTFLGASISNVVADFILLVLPVPMLWNLQVSRSRKFALVGVFVAGYFVIVLSILRLKTILDLGNSFAEDISWNLSTPQILVTIELPLALVSSCLPSIFQLAKRFAFKNFRTIFNGAEASKPLSGPGGSNIGRLANPIDPSKKAPGRGFRQLQSDGLGSRFSEERFFDHDGTSHSASAIPVKQKLPSEYGNLDAGIPMHRIHIREDVEIQ